MAGDLPTKRLLRRADFTAEFVAELLREFKYGNVAAQAIASQCVGDNGGPVAARTVYSWINEHGPRRTARGMELAEPRIPEGLNRVAELLEKAGIRPDSIGSIDKAKVKAWGYAMKGPDGLPIEGGLHSTDLTLSPLAPEFPLAQPASPAKIIFQPAARILRKTRQVIVYSDAQIGFLQHPETKVAEPIHDPAALDVALQITGALAPDEQHWIGDWMDWPFLSRWQQHDEFDAVNESIEEGHRWLARLRAATSRRCKKRVMIGSNHGYRPEKFLLEHNRKAMRIRRAADTSHWPVFSEPYLLRFEDLGIDFSGHYPGGEYYVLPDLMLIHAPPKKLEFAASVIHGHLHKLTRTTTVQHAAVGRQTYFVYDTGCLCQVGATSDRQRLMATRVPSDRARTEWAQGISVISIVDALGSGRAGLDHGRTGPLPRPDVPGARAQARRVRGDDSCYGEPTESVQAPHARAAGRPSQDCRRERARRRGRLYLRAALPELRPAQPRDRERCAHRRYPYRLRADALYVEKLRMDGYELPNGVTIRIPPPPTDESAYRRAEILAWTKAVRERGLLIHGVPEELQQQVYHEICERADAERQLR